MAAPRSAVPVAPLTTGYPAPRELGAGRSGVVFEDTDARGRRVARKLFRSDRLTKLVQVLFLGCPNPYAWNEDAVRCALLRRRILAPLVRVWFGDRLCVAEALGIGYDERERAFELHTRFVNGRPPTLHHPGNRRGAEEVSELWEQIVRPLQAHLAEAGFDGLLWQAGLGNPVALANFLRLETEGGGWAWIDLESGVPALFPANPLRLFSTYLPLSLEHGRPLFDDVDVEKLRRFLHSRARGLSRALGTQTLARMLEDTDALERHQRAWKSPSRREASVLFAHARGHVDAEQRDYYLAHPLRWTARLAARVPRALLSAARSLRDSVAERVRRVPWKHLPGHALAFVTSVRFRRELARALVRRRIDSWAARGQLLREEARQLDERLEVEGSSTYLTDFGVHAALNPVMKAFEWLVLPPLYVAGHLSEAQLGLAIVAAGPLARTAYTLVRCVRCTWRREERPWVALAVGILPAIGNLAYPLQIVSRSREREDVIAQFILYDACSLIGRRLPFFGGRDTLLEHALNHLPDRIVRGR